LKRRTSAADIRFVVLRLKRVRNPDLVFLELLEHFLHEMQRAGRTVQLCGVRPELAKPMTSLRFPEWLPAGSVFLEEEKLYSSTIKAVRRAYELLGSSSANGHGVTRATPEPQDTFYYLV
jgi:SulP family sulfate permease